MNKLSLIILPVLIICSCRKEKIAADPPAPVYAYILNNNTQHELVFKAYVSEAGYWGLDSSKPYIDKVLQPGEQGVVAFTNTRDSGIFYADIYSPDYRYTNWSSRYSFRKTATGDTVNINDKDLSDLGNIRRLFLKDLAVTRWYVYAATDQQGNDIWPQMRQEEKNTSFALHKGWYMTTQVKDSNGAMQEAALSLLVWDLRHPPAYFLQMGNSWRLNPMYTADSMLREDTALVNVGGQLTTRPLSKYYIARLK